MGCGMSTQLGAKSKKIGKGIEKLLDIVLNELNPSGKAKAYEALKKDDVFLLKKIINKYNMKPMECIGPKDGQFTCIHFAAQTNSYKCMKYLLDSLIHLQEHQEPQVNQEESQLQQQPQQKQGILELILNLQDKNGNTPIMLCAIYSSLESLYLLLSMKKLDFKVKNFRNQTFFDLMRYSYPSLSELLNAFGLDSRYIDDFKDIYTADEKHDLILYLRQKIKIAEGYMYNNPNVDPLIQHIDPNSKIYTILSDCLQKQANFIDNDFFHSVDTICKDKSHEKYAIFEGAIWKRPSEIINKGQIFLFNDINPNDIEQGALGVCYFLSALSALAEYPTRVKLVFNNQEYTTLGAYSVNFYKLGVKTEIVIDDYFPCGYKTDSPMFSKPLSNEIWVLVLEKAWAKRFGNYCVTEAGHMDEVFEDILGAPSELVVIKDLEIRELWSYFKDYDSNKYLFCAGTNSDSNENKGLLSNHGYTILGVYQYEKYKLIKLRNPLAKFEWNGDFSDKSRLWKQKLKDEVHYYCADDGVFWMKIEDFVKYFSFYSVCYYRDNYIRDSISIESEHNHAEYFEFSLNRPIQINIKVCQTDKRDSSTSYSPLMIALALARDNKARADDILNIGKGRGSSSRTLWASNEPYLELAPGDYILRVKSEWNNKSKNPLGVMTCSDLPLKLVHVDRKKHPGFLSNWLLSFALEKFEGLTNLGHDCYFKTFTWLRKYTVIFAFNKGITKIWTLKISLKKLSNMKIGKPFKVDNNTISIKLSPSQCQVAYLKATGENPEYEWDIDSQFQ